MPRGHAHDHEREFAALRQQQDEERPLVRGNARPLADEPEDRALEREHAHDDPGDEQRMLHEHAEIHAHADGDEEEREQQALERIDRGLDLVAVLGLGEQHAGEERAEGHGEPEMLEEHGHAQHQREREGGEDLAQARAGDVAEDRTGEEVADGERGYDGERRDREVRPRECRLRPGHRHERQQRQHRDGGDVLEEQHGEGRLPALGSEGAPLAQRLQGERRR